MAKQLIAHQTRFGAPHLSSQARIRTNAGGQMQKLLGGSIQPWIRFAPAA